MWIPLIILIVILILVAALILYWPVDPRRFPARPNPARSYPQAEQRIQALQAQEAGRLNPVCQTQFLSYGEKVERAIVFIHGNTSCPQQFAELGKLFHQKGYNVLIAPVPGHGLADRMTEAHAQVTAELLTEYGDRVIDIAQGLGEHITLAGFSMGGVVACWAAQNREDIDLAVLISPGFGFAPVPAALTLPAMNLFSLLPNYFRWWDPALKEKVGPAHAYPRYSTRTLAQILRLSFAVQAQAARRKPSARAIWLVTNANDDAVSYPMIQRVASLWERQAAGRLRTYHFPPELQVGHDLIDPAQPDQRTDIVYPKLIEIIAG